jgi:hypothetical protein
VEYFLSQQRYSFFAQYYRTKKIHKSITAIALNGLGDELKNEAEAMKVFCLLISRISLICQQLLSTISPIIGSFFATWLLIHNWREEDDRKKRCFSPL